MVELLGQRGLERLYNMHWHLMCMWLFAGPTITTLRTKHRDTPSQTDHYHHENQAHRRTLKLLEPTNKHTSHNMGAALWIVQHFLLLWQQTNSAIC